MTDNLINSAIEVASRLQEGSLEGVLVQEVDLSQTGLPKAQTRDSTFKRVALHGADARDGIFSRTRFSEASFRGVRFDRSIFRGSSFFNGELIEAHFEDSMLQGTSFFSSRLGNADFSGARIQSCNFNSSELFGARFPRALIINTKFEAAERGNIALDRGDFSNAVLIDCDLSGTNLFGANFQNALLVKVDLRHANLTQANFEGARLVDVRIDTSQLEPRERRMVEEAKLDDPWRSYGFMDHILAPYENSELSSMLEYLLRTYVIETTEVTSDSSHFPSLIQSIKAQYDFPELEHIRIRSGNVQVQMGREWFDLGVPLSSEHLPSDEAPTEEDPGAPETPRRPSLAFSDPSESGRRGSDAFPDALSNAMPDPMPAPERVREPEKKASQRPKKVTTSKRFRKLELD